MSQFALLLSALFRARLFNLVVGDLFLMCRIGIGFWGLAGAACRRLDRTVKCSLGKKKAFDK